MSNRSSRRRHARDRLHRVGHAEGFARARVAQHRRRAREQLRQDRLLDFPHREPGYNLVLIGQWLDPAETAANVAWVRETYAALEPYMAPKNYVNYLADDEGDLVANAYGPNLARLVEVKRHYDPDNLFRLNHNIDPTG